MTNLRNLKGLAEYQKISIKDDYTLAERDMVRKFQEEANKLKARRGGPGSKIHVDLV